MNQQDAIARFRVGPTTLDRFQALLDLSRDRKLFHQAVETPDFAVGLDAISVAAQESTKDFDCVLAVVALSRIRAVVKSLQERIDREFEKCLRSPLPSPFILQNPDDRVYLAQACGVVWFDWMRDYLAEAIALEEAGEKARAEYVSALFSNTQAMNDVFPLIGTFLEKWIPGTEAPGDSSARRLRRIVAAIRPSLRGYTGDVPLTTGDDVCKLIRSAFRNSGSPNTSSLASETSEDIAGLVYDLIRTRFSLATEKHTYAPFLICASWHKSYLWDRFVRSSDNIRLVSRDLLEGISLLARMGKTDSMMVSSLGTLIGKDQALARLANLATTASDLDQDIREWLANGGKETSKAPTRHSDLAEESQANRDNELLADLLIDAEQLKVFTQNLQTNNLIELQMISSKAAEPFEKQIKMTLFLADAVTGFTDRRHLKLQDRPNAIVDYSPLNHELVKGFMHGIRKVRIIRPPVIKVGGSGLPSLVKKGLVEEI